MNKFDLRVSEGPNLVRDEALRRLRAAIVDGVYNPGDRLIERELCERMAISRTSVREVLRQLESEQLIRVEPRRGPVVAAISAEQARDIYEFRRMLEPAAVRLFMERAGKTELKQLRAAIEAFRTAVETTHLGGMVESMADFYETLFRGAGNSEIRAVGGRMLARISALRRASMSRPGRAPHSLREMEQLCAAIEAGDKDKAAEAAARHVDEARAAVLG
ncbi:GntR family transcriptional regulator [Rhodovarius crocodyli]|nr:GntR family transcriptional regulator [Rhodovarius crocodyli]